MSSTVGVEAKAADEIDFSLVELKLPNKKIVENFFSAFSRINKYLIEGWFPYFGRLHEGRDAVITFTSS
jgi:hypothetical protein